MSRSFTPAGRTNRWFRLGAAGAVSLLLMAGCGNRTSGGSGSGLGGATTTAAGGTGASGSFGTLTSPCGPGDAKGASDVGVTDSTIKIGVISDKDAGVIRVPTAGIEASMQAFVSYCNGQGGINGRKLELKTYDAKLVKSLDAIKAACDDNLFALVGVGVVQDAPMAQPMIDCGLVAVPAYTATYSMSLNPNMVAPVPNPGNTYATGEAAYIAKTYPDAIKKSAIFYPSLAASASQGERIVQARTKLGYDFIYTGTYPLIEDDWKTQIQTLKNKGVEYVTIVDAANAAVSMLQAMQDAGYHPKVIDLGQQFYDSSIAASGLADGVLFQTNTQPFERPNAAISEYTDLLKKVAPDVPVTSLGVQGFSAGLLFATAAKELGPDLTRKGLLDELHKIHDWDGGGLHPPQDPGANKANTCFMLLTVEKKKFVPVYPKTDATDPAKSFECDSSMQTKVSGNWGAIPHAK
jgi:ABC-type branched-subunit amino acid transport system substrate-binding protein